MLKALETQADLEEGRDFLRISVEARGKTGVLSRIFGGEAAERATPQHQVLEGEALDQVTTRIVDGKKVV